MEFQSIYLHLLTLIFKDRMPRDALVAFIKAADKTAIIIHQLVKHNIMTIYRYDGTEVILKINKGT